MKPEDWQQALAETAAATAKFAHRADVMAEFPVEALAAMRRTGLLGMVVPTEFGGLGGSLSDVVNATMSLAREDMSVAMIFTMHCQQALAIVRHAAPRLRNELLPAIARGDLYLASVTTEPRTGGHLLSSTSSTTSDGDVLRIDRDAPIVTGGEYADGFLVTVLAPDETQSNLVSLVYASRDQLEIQVAGEWQPMGMRATQSVPMRLVGAVPSYQVVGGHGEFRSIVTSVFGPAAHFGWSAAWLGAATGALSRVVHHIRSSDGRRQFDTKSELLLTRLARVRARLDTVHALLQHTLRTWESADASQLSTAPVQLLLNALKTQAAEQCFAAIDEIVELLGLRHGYLQTSPLAIERIFRDLRSASLNYSNDRLYLVSGTLVLLDQEVRLA